MLSDKCFDGTYSFWFEVTIAIFIGYLCRKEAIPSRRTPGRSFARPESSNPDGYAWLLHWLRQKRHILNLVMLARVAKRLPAHKSSKNIQALVQQFGALF